MSSVIIDTNVYCNAFRGMEYGKCVFKKFDKILMSPIVLGELMYGFLLGSRKHDNLKQLDLFIKKPRVTCLEITLETSRRFSQIIAELKISGNPIPTNDIWIAASAFEHGAYLASEDAHFKNIKGLYIV